jgi:sugar/nucleoside kinase (ribokinase family)
MNKKILGIGNAIVDVFAQVEERFLKENNIIKGSMKLINEEEFFELKKKIKIEKILAGGSVANSMAGISYLDGDASFIGKINSDEFGELYKKSLENIDVEFLYNPKKELMPTGTCIILITPDSERTMCTYLGISSQLAANDLNEKNIIDKELIFLEGYLWDKGLSEKMFKKAINLAKKNKVKIAMTLSDIFCVTRHKVDFYNLLKNDLDVLIGNENEINELTGNKNLSNSINQLILLNKLIIITRSEKGSLAIDNNIIIDCDSIQVNKVIDVTGAGDLFAAGFLKEYVEKSEIKKCLTTGSLIASKIIQKIGARIE